MSMTSPLDAPEFKRDEIAIVILAFEKDHVPIPNAKEGEPAMREVHRVRWGKRGYANWEQSEAVSRLKKGNPQLWEAAFARAYEYWLKGEEEPTDGTPLSGWPGITKGQVDACKGLHVRSVEDLAKADAPTISRLGMGAVALVDRAKTFCANKGHASLAAENADLKASLAELQRQIAEDRAAFNEFVASSDKKPVQPPAPPKKVA